MKVYNEKSDKPISSLLLKTIDEMRTEKNFNVKDYVIKKAKLLNSYMSKFNLKSCVVAISGGIDSAVVL